MDEMFRFLSTTRFLNFSQLQGRAIWGSDAYGVFPLPVSVLKCDMTCSPETIDLAEQKSLPEIESKQPIVTPAIELLISFVLCNTIFHNLFLY